MANLRRVALLLMSVAMFLSATWTSSSANAAAWTPSPVPQDSYGYSVSDLAYGPETYSHILGLSDQQIAGMPNEYICNGELTGDCDPAKTTLQAMLVLPPCEGNSSPDCIASVKIGQVGALETAALAGVTGEPVTDKSPAVGLPSGGAPSIWKTESSATPYVVLAVMKLDWRTNKFVPTTLSAQVVPFQLLTGSFTPPTASVRILDNGRSSLGFYTDARCIWQDRGRCGVREDFADGVQIQLSLRVSSALGGWFKGRLINPDFAVTPTTDGENLITVTGSQAKVPQLQAWVSQIRASQAIQNLFSPKNMAGYAGGGVGLQASYSNTPAFVNAFRDAANDTAAGMLTDWSFSTIGSTGNPCLSDTSKVLGIVTTNASIYDGQAPEFADGALVYRVGGYHWLKDGSLNLGTYDLILRKETARCLYGFSSAPMTASVSVSSDAGPENVATTNFAEVGDWDHFTAYGFTFSNPKIEVKLSQAVGPDPAPPATAAPTPIKHSSATKTITCVKGKVVKRVSGTKPKCPAGYKKK